MGIGLERGHQRDIAWNHRAGGGRAGYRGRGSSGRRRYRAGASRGESKAEARQPERIAERSLKITEVQSAYAEGAAGDRGRGKKVHPDIARAFGADLDDDRLNENLHAGNVEFRDDVAQNFPI